MIQKTKPNDSESDTLLSGDEDILNFKPTPNSATSSSLLHASASSSSAAATILDGDMAIILTSSTSPSSKQHVQQRTSVINI